jgi:peptidoglycan/xylan/chitin deacetylase (PgdA/CDA1 family)
MFKSKKLVFILTAIVLIALSQALFLRSNYMLPIIMYHSVNPSAERGNMLVVSDKTFLRQMRFLKEHHYNVVPLETVYDLIKNKKKIPMRTIAITFDDGYKDNYTYAFPILKKYNFPATIFVIVNEVERPEGDRLSWGQMRAMQDSGIITIGSHTLSHIYFNEVYPDEQLKKEISGSKIILEEKLGRKINTFAYPGGRFNAKVKQLVIDAGYQMAVATNPGDKYPDDDIFVLKRLRISENAGNLFIFWVETSGFYNFMREHKMK